MTETITVLHYQGIGDNLLALPLVRALRESFPAARLQVMVPAKRFGLYSGTGVDKLFSYAERAEPLGASGGVVFDLDPGSGDPVYCALIRSLRCQLFIGFDTPRAAAPQAGRQVRLRIAEKPMWRQYLDLGELLAGTPLPDPEPPVLACTPAARREAAGRLGSLGRSPLVCVAPGAGAVEKRWPAESFAAVIRHLRERHGAAVVLLGSDDEKPLAASALATTDPGILDLFGLPIEASAAAMSRACLTLANDSAMLHMAAALGIPAIGIYSRYCSPQTHRPMGHRFTVLYAKGASPDTIAPGEILPHVDRYLSQGRLATYWRQSCRVVVLQEAR